LAAYQKTLIGIADSKQNPQKDNTMATPSKSSKAGSAKKAKVKVSDLKPTKDAKGGALRRKPSLQH